MCTLRIVLLSQSIFAVFIAGGLFFKSGNLRSRSISLFVLLFGLEIAEYLYSTSSVVYMYPQYYGLAYFPIGFLYGPLLFIHLSTLLERKQSTLHYALHFIPFLVMIIFMMDIYAMDGAERIIHIKENFLNRIMPYNYARAIHILGYGIACLVIVRKKHDIDNTIDRLYATAICVIYFFAAALIFIYTLFADNWRQFIYYYVVVNAIVLIIGYLLYSKPNFLKSLSKKYFSSTLSQDLMEKIKVQIHEKVVESRAFLDRGLNLKKMADLIGESSHRISQTMSVLVGKNFNDYVNFYRIENAKELLLDTKFDHYKIEAIAIESGFNNKVTFYKAFVKQTGVTPSVFRQEHKK